MRRMFMLSFEDSLSLESTLDTMRSVDNENDYLQHVLLPALLRGDWEELDSMVVYQDERMTILFGEDEWRFIESAYKGKNKVNFHFTIDTGQAYNVITFHQNERNLINQLKCVALADMWFSAKSIQLSSIRSRINYLRNDITQLIKRGITSLNELNQEHLEMLVDEGMFDTSRAKVFAGMNYLPTLKGLLPFEVNFQKLTHKMFNSRPDEAEGKVVIPPRIYFAALTEYSEEVAKAYGVRDEIEQAVEKAIYFYNNEIAKRLTEIRNKGNYAPPRGHRKSWRQFCIALDKAGIPLLDKNEDPRWMEIFTALETKINIQNQSLRRFNVCIGKTYYNWSELRKYLTRLNARASWLCLALSGMRVDEFYRMSPVYGAQKMKFDKNGCESDTGKEIIYFLSVRQSKISLNSQTKNDVFVTTKTGWKAFYVLNAIHTPYRNRFAENDKHRMIASLVNIVYFKPLKINGVHANIKDNFNSDNFDFTLTSEDMGYLQTSDPTQTSFKENERFYFTCHQTRRSLAYYLIGYELCSFPALKQQLSHLSMAMTRWYARNAYSFEQLYSEIKSEQITQKAEIFARIYKKIANGERIAGGKGQAMVVEISREGESYFEDGISRRKLSVDYWIDQLTNGIAHLHAVAPGMYCTNTQCSMRINIDLSECVDCEYDFIENAVYAESSRIDAMRNIELLKEHHELNSSSATKYVMQVKAAEEIMDDLGFEHEKYEFTEDVLSLVIDTVMEA